MSATSDNARVRRLEADVELMAAHVESFKTRLVEMTEVMADLVVLVEQMSAKLGLLRADLVEGR